MSESIQDTAPAPRELARQELRKLASRAPTDFTASLRAICGDKLKAIVTPDELKQLKDLQAAHSKAIATRSAHSRAAAVKHYRASLDKHVANGTPEHAESLEKIHDRFAEIAHVAYRHKQQLESDAKVLTDRILRKTLPILDSRRDAIFDAESKIAESLGILNYSAVDSKFVQSLNNLRGLVERQIVREFGAAPRDMMLGLVDLEDSAK